MPKTVTPMQVGTFVLVALFLALGMILFFSTTTLFSSTQSYIMYFEDSVKGLSVGSSVKFKGVPIGQVKKIYISYNQAATSARIPVLIEIESEQLAQLANLRKVSVNDVLQREIDNGLRAQLQIESFITGLLFIDLNYYTNAPPAMYYQENKIYREIPTMRTPFSDLGNSANDLIARLSAVDYEGLANELKGLASNLNTALSSVDFQKLGPAFTQSMTSLNAILGRAEKLDVSGNLVESLKSIRTASDELSGMVNGESASGQKLQHLADNLSEAAEAVSRLANYLEEHPNALLTGKPADE